MNWWSGFSVLPLDFCWCRWYFWCFLSSFCSEYFGTFRIGAFAPNRCSWDCVLALGFLVYVVLWISVYQMLCNVFRIDVFPLVSSRALEPCVVFWIWRLGIVDPRCECWAFLCLVAAVCRHCFLSWRFKCFHMGICAPRRESGLLLLFLRAYFLVPLRRVDGGIFFPIFLLYRLVGVSALAVFALSYFCGLLF